MFRNLKSSDALFAVLLVLGSLIVAISHHATQYAAGIVLMISSLAVALLA
jgi:hypothetical protein